MQKWKTGSLLVTDSQAYVGFITDSALARDVVANGLDPNTTSVQSCVRKPLVSIRGDRPLIEAVRLDEGAGHPPSWPWRKTVKSSVSFPFRIFCGITRAWCKTRSLVGRRRIPVFRAIDYQPSVFTGRWDHGTDESDRQGTSPL